MATRQPPSPGSNAALHLHRLLFQHTAARGGRFKTEDNLVADLWPRLHDFVGILASAYDVFAARVTASRDSGSKQDRVRNYVLHHASEEFRIADIRAAPGVSDPTIRFVLRVDTVEISVRVRVPRAAGARVTTSSVTARAAVWRGRWPARGSAG